MLPDEPQATALALVTIGALMALSAATSRFSGRLGVPLTLVFLGVGMLAGREGIGGLVFDDAHLAFQLGYVALVLILFDGGLNTPLKVMRAHLFPAIALATLGVVTTATVVGFSAYLLGVDGRHAFLLGAIVSSTDAAAVFSVLRTSGIQLARRVGITLEIESGLNDPMAVILTIAATRMLLTSEPVTAYLLLDVARELFFGAVIGVGVGQGGRVLLSRARLIAGGLYPVVTLALAGLAFGIATLIHGSGFLAVYVSAVLLGGAALPYRAAVIRVHDAAAWLAQVGMFLVLGLLVVPSRLFPVAGLGLILGLVLAFIARPLAVALSLLPFRFPWRERAYIAWVGLRGAVPIILATYPIMARAQGADATFHLVFFIVVVNALIPGATIKWVTDKLGLRSDEPPPPPAVLEITSSTPLRGKVLAFFVDKASAASGVQIRDLPFPPGASVMVIVREGALVAPRGDVELSPGDHLYVIANPEDEPFVRLMFGQQEEL